MARWAARFVLRAKSAYLPVNRRDHVDALNLAAALVVLAADRLAAFHALCALLVGENRTRYWHRALTQVPPEGRAVDQLTRTVREYETRAMGGRFESLTAANFSRVDRVVEGMLAVRQAPGPYLDAVAETFHRYPTKVFSAEVRRRVAPKLRGLFGSLATDDRQARDLEGIPVVG